MKRPPLFPILAAMFCIGIFSVLAQVTFMREMLVVFYGNELSIGTILACWLLGIGAGASSTRLFRRRLPDAGRIQWLLSGVLLLLSVALPAQVYAVRTLRLLLNVPAGEYVSFGAILLSSFLVFLPSCLGTGLFFPLACEALVRGTTDPAEGRHEMAGGAGAVSLVYTFEAAGSMIGGIALTYILLPVMTPGQVVLLAVCVAGIGAAFVVPRGRGVAPMSARVVVLLWAVLAGTAALTYPAVVASGEQHAIAARWRAFGVLRDAAGEAGGIPVARLVRSDNTIYQNLAITESEEQYALYGNGQVMFVFPDPIGYEHDIHFIMAQRPDAKRVLLIGGNPVGDIPELLKYPLERLVYVEIDPGIGRMIREVVPGEYAGVFADERLEYVPQDGPRFVRECRDRFDVVLVNAPGPVTAAANRFYTIEFFRNISRILDDKGFMYTSVTSSARLQSEALDVGASVYATLKAVFPVVLVTAETTNRFFAGGRGAGLTFEREVLFNRSAGSGIRTRFFAPQYFLGADEISPDKTAYVTGRFSEAEVPLNTNLKPVTYFYNLVLWSRFSGSRMEQVLGKARSFDSRHAVLGFLAAGCLCLVVGALVRACRRRSARGREAGGDAAGGSWSRLMIGVLIATTGFCGIALEIILIFVFQGLYGYVYTRIGLIVAMFMLGLVAGAPSGRMLAHRGQRFALFCMAGVELLLLGFALCVPMLAALEAVPANISRFSALAEPVTYLAVCVVGWAVGAEFPLGNRLFCDAGGRAGVAAAVTDASDHVGAAIGALVVGVLLVPVFGMASSCTLLAALKGAGLLCLLSACLAMPGVGATATRRE